MTKKDVNAKKFQKISCWPDFGWFLQRSHIIEIQRRSRSVENESGEKQNAEESYTGFVFMTDDQQQVDETIQYFMSRVRSVKGIVKNLLRDCPISKAHAFQHKGAGFEKVACEAAVLNALGKMGVKLS